MSNTLTRLPLFLVVFTVLLLTHPADAQAPRFGESAPDSSSRPQIVLPGLSPYMIGPRQWELLAFSTYNTQKLEYKTDDTRQLRLTNDQYFFLFMLGVSPERRFNVGLELQAAGVSQGPAEKDPTLAPLRYQALSALGLRVRTAPLSSLPELTFQGALLVPVAGDRNVRQALGRDRLQFLVQANIYQQFLPWLYIFLQADASVFFKNQERQQTSYSFPVSLYAVGEILPQRLYLYPSLAYAGNYTPGYKAGLISTGHQLLGGLGVQYVFSPHFSLNVQAQKPLSYDFTSQAFDYSAGTYSGFSVGLRCVN